MVDGLSNTLLASVNVTEDKRQVELRTVRDARTGMEITVLHDAYGQISDAVAAAIRETRKQRGWNAADLAARCGAIGAGAITANVIENIESGRRKDGKRTRDITVDELAAIAQALGVPPAVADAGTGRRRAGCPGAVRPGRRGRGPRAALGAVEDARQRLATRQEDSADG